MVQILNQDAYIKIGRIVIVSFQFTVDHDVTKGGIFGNILFPPAHQNGSPLYLHIGNHTGIATIDNLGNLRLDDDVQKSDNVFVSGAYMSQT